VRQSDEPELARVAAHDDRALDVVEEAHALGIHCVRPEHVLAGQEREIRERDRECEAVVRDLARRVVVHVRRDTVHRRAVGAHDADEHRGRAAVGREHFAANRDRVALPYDVARLDRQRLHRVRAAGIRVRLRDRPARARGFFLVIGEIGLSHFR
jgi:hypothetical protein